MRIAAFGDIHSNHIALEACMKAVERMGVDGIAFLGDYVSDCAWPQKTLTQIREIAERYPCWFIRGNREEYMIDHADGLKQWQNNSRSGSLLYTFENLTKEDIEGFRRLPISLQVQPEGTAPFEMCHGAPWQTRVMLLPGSDLADRAFSMMQTNLLLCAHTHETFIEERKGKVIVNGGPVGVPGSAGIGASFAVIEWIMGKWEPRLVHVDYDAEQVIREFHESGFMERGGVWARAIAAMLRTGRNYSVECLALVEKYALETGLSLDEEAIWQRAADQLEI